MSFARDDLVVAPARFTLPYRVRFQDIDAAGIVFYPRILELFHDAYVALLADAGQWLHTAIASGEYLAPIKHAEADFLRPLRFGDAVEIAVVRSRLENSTLTLGYRLSADGQPAAVGHTVHVYVDRSFKRTPPPPALVRLFTS